MSFSEWESYLDLKSMKIECVMDVISMCYGCDINVFWTLCDMFGTLWDTLRHLDTLRDTILEIPEILDTATRDAYASKNVEAMLRYFRCPPQLM